MGILGYEPETTSHNTTCVVQAKWNYTIEHIR